MKVVIKKLNGRNQLTCHRPDGTVETANLGPSLPRHDLAHFVVESRLDIRNGFYDNIANGYSVAQLSAPEVIRTLGPQTWVAEIAARALQSLASGACRPEQFEELIGTELAQFSIPTPANLSPAVASALLAEFRELLAQFDALAQGEALELNFRSPTVPAAENGAATSGR